MKIGDRVVFTFDGEDHEYIVARPECMKACLISLDNGNRWTDAIKVEALNRLNDEEIRQLTNGEPYRLVETEQ